MKNSSTIKLINNADQYTERTAIIDDNGTYTYQDLLNRSANVTSYLLNGKKDLNEARVAFITPSGFDYVATQWGIWRAGAIAVPLCVTHPDAELEYVIDDSQAEIIVAHTQFADRIKKLSMKENARFILTDEAMQTRIAALSEVDESRRAMIIYTSGTTSKPKGVVTTHKNIKAHITSLVEAWAWNKDDYILNVLPLHHVHGIVNVLLCALWSGAKCEMLPRFDPDIVWNRFIERDFTLFMAVPTIYNKLIHAWEKASTDQKKQMKQACQKMRLMVSGSAALPVSTLEKWKEISGHVLLERYGMTEIGMALSNPLHGERVPGYVGTPLLNVEVRLVNESGNLVEPGTPGEIQVKGPGVFLEYWGKPDITEKAFCDGWFLTGDIAVKENGIYRILGRNSVDIIKTGGYKVSALEIEEVLRTHPDIEECAVVGVEDLEWGERVCAVLVLKGGSNLTLESLREWTREWLAVYKIPTRILVLDDLPRNAMGKVTKPNVVQLFKAEKQSADN